VRRLRRYLKKSPLLRRASHAFPYVGGLLALYVVYQILEGLYLNSRSSKQARYQNAAEQAKKRVEALQKLK